MKIRKGFVSNSSSSSFVVAFPKMPETTEEVREMMFGKQEWHFSGDHNISTKEIAKMVFEEIEGKESASKLKIYNAIRHGWFDFYYDPKLLPGNYTSNESYALDWKKDADKIKEIWAHEEDVNNQRAIDIANAFLKINKDCFVSVMSFGDEDGEFDGMMEHSGIFKHLENIRTSYH